MATPLVYADFQNLDDENRLRLTCAGTRQDLEREGIELREGLRLTLYTDDANDEGQPDRLLANGIVQYNQGEKSWVAAIDWNAIRHESDIRKENGSHFEFPKAFGDARVEELKLLSWTDQHRELCLASVPSGPWHDLLVSLVSSDFLTVFSFNWAKCAYSSERDPHPDLAGHVGTHPEDTPLFRAMASAKVRAVYDLYESRPPAGLRLTHAGRVRLSELKQALRTGREREPFGILWDVRHWQQDLQIAILDAREGAPLALAYLDMNGLKQVNETHQHDAGDLALRAYFQAVASALGDRGQAYRLGGDEVLVVLPNHDAEAAVRLLRLACTKLMGERLEPTGGSLLSVSAGVTTTSDPSASPTELRSVADKVQYRAKQRSREATPRPSVIAIDGQTDMIVIEPSADSGTRVAS